MGEFISALSLRLRTSYPMFTSAVMVFLIFASTEMGMNITAQGNFPLPREYAFSTMNLLVLNNYYFYFLLTFIVMLGLVLRNVSFVLGDEIATGKSKSMLILPIPRGYLIISEFIADLLIPYFTTSLSIFIAMHLIGFQFNIVDAVAVSLLNIIFLAYIVAISILIALSTGNSSITMVGGFTFFLAVGLLTAFSDTLVSKFHSTVPLLILGILFPSAPLYYYTSYHFTLVGAPSPFGPSPMSPVSYIPPYALSFSSVVTDVVASTVVAIVLILSVCWYYVKRFEPAMAPSSG